MDKAQRQELIRQRFRAKAGKLQYVGTGRKRKPVETPSGRINAQSFGLAISHKWGRTQWLETPDPKVEPTVSTKHRKGIPALTVIAAKAPKKLKRVVATAEELLSERKRQWQP